VLKNDVVTLGNSINTNNEEMVNWIDNISQVAARSLTKAIGVVAGTKAVFDELWKFIRNRIERIVKIFKLDELWGALAETNRRLIDFILKNLSDGEEGLIKFQKIFVETSQAAAFEAWSKMQEIFNANPLEFTPKAILPDKPSTPGEGFAEFSIAQLQRMLANENLAGKERERIWKEVNERIKAGNVGMWESFTAGAMDAVEQFGNSAQQMMDLGRKMTDSLTDNLGDAFYDMVTGVKSFKEAFSDMARSFGQEVLRMITRLIALRTVQATLNYLFPGAGTGAALLTGENGGIFPGGLTPIPAFANGGTVRQPTIGLIGEGRYNEAVVPLPDGRSIPVNMQGNAGGGDTYQITINAVDAKSFAELIDRNPESIVGAISSSIRNRGTVFNDIRRFAR